MHWRRLFLVWALFYLLISLYYLVTGINDFHIINSIALLVLSFLTRNLDWNIPRSAVWLFGLALLFNTLGVFPIQISEDVANLYSLEHYDTLAHLIGMMLFSLSVFLTYRYVQERLKVLHIGILFFALFGIGACLEITEYSGYRLFGYGAGWLRFGEGDNSTNFGPWGDSMTDMLANLIGITCGLLLLAISVKVENFWNKRKKPNIAARKMRKRDTG